ncbi:hypothetical protein [Prosthecobacter sp.]|uniref:hypothetical protein n=1 Tax=Prosthecobacter sp. TaxID=1965333 RepID=UPI002ABCF397|nr:hypothetical protein [Prosthecobacter sp.]MDZ4401767.1 hypothetical protein [Prosthecobacter sp.]
MKTTNTSHLLNSLETGLRTDSSQLIGLERNLASMLHRSRRLGAEYGSPGDWITSCHQQWDNIENILQRISGRMDEMHDAIASSNHDRLNTAWDACETIESEEIELVGELSSLRTHAIQLNEAARNDWNMLTLVIEFHVNTIHACSQAVRVRLELLKENSRNEDDGGVPNSPSPGRPGAGGMDAATCTWTFDKAAIEIEQEQHQVLGFVDDVKALFMWVETPEERVNQNRSLSGWHA